MKTIMIGLDIAKNVFQVHGIDEAGNVVHRRQLRRSQLEAFFAGLAPAVVGMEACGTAHHWARLLHSLGHEVRLMAPAYVKPYVKRNKTDGRDAEAICEAMQRPTMRFVAVKSVEQQAVTGLAPGAPPAGAPAHHDEDHDGGERRPLIDPAQSLEPGHADGEPGRRHQFAAEPGDEIVVTPPAADPVRRRAIDASCSPISRSGSGQAWGGPKSRHASEGWHSIGTLRQTARSYWAPAFAGVTKGW